MNVHRRDGSFHRAQNVAVVKRRQPPWKAALNADLSCANLRRFDASLRLWTAHIAALRKRYRSAPVAVTARQPSSNKLKSST